MKGISKGNRSQVKKVPQWSNISIASFFVTNGPFQYKLLTIRKTGCGVYRNSMYYFSHFFFKSKAILKYVNYCYYLSNHCREIVFWLRLYLKTWTCVNAIIRKGYLRKHNYLEGVYIMHRHTTISMSPLASNYYICLKRTIQ